MADTHNEITGTVHGPVVQVGHVDSITFGGNAAEPVEPLVAWPVHPVLPEELADLLNAQRHATETLPYKLLGVRQPELTQVYVQRAVRPHSPDRSIESDQLPAGRGGLASESTERPIDLGDALNRNRHIVLIGEPGSGKSTIGHMYVQEISAFWVGANGSPPSLAEPVLPLRIPARALAEENSWSELLADGARDVLGTLLSARPRAELFARRAIGARWLVFIDGLDEIIEPEKRARVINAISYQVRKGGDHRLVITTRPLFEAELWPLEQAGIDRFEIQPFGPVELNEFAKRWFSPQGATTYMRRAGEFVEQVGDGRLRELVRNPLLATIAAIAYTLEPERKLPNSRVRLYQRFMDYLLGDNASGRKTLDELRRASHDQPRHLELIEWLDEQRTEIIEHLAVLRLEGDSSLVEAACVWVKSYCPERIGLPNDWDTDLRALLSGAGIFVQNEDDLRFLHHSFAEFLAARQRAGEIPPHFPDLDQWVMRGLTGAQQDFALFTFVLWGLANDIGQVLRRLLAGTKEKILLAGRLLAEDVQAQEEIRVQVVERLIDVLLVTGTLDDPWDDVDSISRVLVLLGTDLLGEDVLVRLRRLRNQPEIAVTTKLACATVLGRLGDGDEAVEWLEAVADDVDLPALAYLTQSLAELAPDGADRAERLLTRLGGWNRPYPATMVLIELLLDRGRTNVAARLVGDLVRRLRADPAVEPGSHVVPMVLPGARHETRIMDLTWDGEAAQPSWSVLTELAFRAGCVTEAQWAAEMVLHEDDPSGDDIDGAMTVLLSTQETAASVDRIMAIVATRPTGDVITVASRFCELHHEASALELAAACWARQGLSKYEVESVAEIFVECGHTSELLSLVQGNPHLGPDHLARIADALPAEYSALATKLARQAFEPASIGSIDFRYAARAMLNPDEPSTADEVFQAALAHGPEHWGDAAEALSEAGYPEKAVELMDRLLDIDASMEAWVEVADFVTEDGVPIQLASSALTAMYERAHEGDLYLQTRVVESLTRAGRHDDANALARRVFRSSINDDTWLDDAVESWLEAGGAGRADEIVNEILHHDINAEARLKAATKLAEAGLLAAACAVWLNVVRHHGAAVDQGIAAASRLMRCGRRADAIAVLDDALADDPLSLAVRTNLRALRAWVRATVEE